MKKLLLIYIIITTIITGCSTTNEKVSETDSESNELTLENPYKIEELKEAFFDRDYTLVEKLANEISLLYPDSYDEALANVYLDLANDVTAEKEAELANIDFKNYIQILNTYTDEPNSSGGVDLHIEWKNTSDKTIKYITFVCNLYNAVDDMVACTISDDYTFRGQVTGPISPGTTYGYNKLWENAWWNNTGKYPKLIGIEIEYMDGTEIEIPESRINELFY